MNAEQSTGICQPFSYEGESCDTLDTFMELSVVRACPCQSFLKCRQNSAAASDNTDSYGVCV